MEITAKQAKLNNELYIYEQIRKASEEGRSSIGVFIYSDELKTKLRNSDFTVEKAVNGRNENECRISWEK